MNIRQLIDALVYFETEIGSDGSVDLMIEVLEPAAHQYQFPLQDVALSRHERKVILVHEKFGSEDLEGPTLVRKKVGDDAYIYQSASQVPETPDEPAFNGNDGNFSGGGANSDWSDSGSAGDSVGGSVGGDLGGDV